MSKISRKLSFWKKVSLKRGKLTLIQFVLRSIPSYYLSHFRILVSVSKELEKLVRSFL